MTHHGQYSMDMWEKRKKVLTLIKQGKCRSEVRKIMDKNVNHHSLIDNVFLFSDEFEEIFIIVDNLKQKQIDKFIAEYMIGDRKVKDLAYDLGFTNKSFNYFLAKHTTSEQRKKRNRRGNYYSCLRSQSKHCIISMPTYLFNDNMMEQHAR